MAGTPENAPSFPKLGQWWPDLNPVQRQLFDCPCRYVLAYGEKGSGKSVGVLDKAVRHCYEEENALAVLITPSLRTAREGAAYELETLILPQWANGIGLEHSPFKMDPVTKDRICWIGNDYDGWSKMVLMSLPYAEVVEPRMKSMSPSFIFIDELTECSSRDYFTYSAAQLGRRAGIRGPQQFYAATNPAGPSHWVYKAFFEEPVARDSKDFKVFHVPISDNERRLPAGYVDHLKELLKYDPVAYAQLINGDWIDRPTGDSLFANYYHPTRHFRGDPLTNSYLTPFPNFPVQVGYDLGSVYHAVVFLQALPIEGGIAWVVFDEICYLKDRITFKLIVRDVLERMKFWKETVNSPLQFEHISDTTALNVWRPSAGGSYDALEIERLSGGQIRMRGSPKGKGSVEARVTLLQNKLFADQILVSVNCHHVHQMLLGLEADPKNPGKPRRSRHLHVFDALTYPLFTRETGGYLATVNDVVLELLHVQR